MLKLMCNLARFTLAPLFLFIALMVAGSFDTIGVASIADLMNIFRANPAEAAGTIYVDASATGTGTGASWTDAYTKLQEALAVATSGDEIWVAAGVYYPDEGGGMTDDDPAATFTMIDGVEIFGGFAGSEINFNQRDWINNVTVLSGDIDQNALLTGNSFHIVSGGGAGAIAVLDGFTISSGTAVGALSSQQEGAGMVNYSSSPTLANLIFTQNHASNAGGGLYNDASNPTLENVIFSENDSNGTGGAIRNKDSTPIMEKVIFSGNQSTFGGGVYNDNSDAIMINVIFSGNLAQFGSGGGIYNASSNPSLTNVSITGNKAGNNGGGVHNTGGSFPTLVNTILWNNLASGSGDQIYNDIGNIPTISFSLIEGCGYSGASWDLTLGIDGGNNYDADPLFVTPINPAAAPTTVGDLHLQPGSPAIDTGKPADCPAIDLDGNMRPIDGDRNGIAKCDMGAYETLLNLYLPLIQR